MDDLLKEALLDIVLAIQLAYSPSKPWSFDLCKTRLGKQLTVMAQLYFFHLPQQYVTGLGQVVVTLCALAPALRTQAR